MWGKFRLADDVQENLLINFLNFFLFRLVDIALEEIRRQLLQLVGTVEKTDQFIIYYLLFMFNKGKKDFLGNNFIIFK